MLMDSAHRCTHSTCVSICAVGFYLAFKANSNTVLVCFNIPRRGFSCEKPSLRAAFLAESYQRERQSAVAENTIEKRTRDRKMCQRAGKE